MPAQLAIAEPRRIKATHRRRSKAAAGQSVQRYYDPAIGRFLSNDPVSTDPNTGASFSRYSYSNNNPFGFTDPDGRMPIGTPEQAWSAIGDAFEVGMEHASTAIAEATPRVVEVGAGIVDVALGGAEIGVGSGLIAASPATAGGSAVLGSALIVNGALTAGDGLISIFNGVTGGNERPIEAQVGQAVAGERGRVVGEVAAGARTANGARQSVVKLAEQPSVRAAVTAAYETATSVQTVNESTKKPEKQ